MMALVYLEFSPGMSHVIHASCPSEIQYPETGDTVEIEDTVNCEVWLYG